METSRGGTLALLFACALLSAGCMPESTTVGSVVTVQEILRLRDLEVLLPVNADSVAALYMKYDKATFNSEYGPRVLDAARLLDSLNGHLPLGFRMDTLSIDHTVENFGVAARVHRTLYLSSSYFFLYADPRVVRSVVFHECGHMLYLSLGASVQDEVGGIWETLSRASLLYLFTDGEYSKNTRFGGHPYDEPGELFASAFNLFQNNIDELDTRLAYIDETYHPVIRRLFEIIVAGAR
jgi:hypothetical protein